MNHQNMRYYSDSNPHWMTDSKCQNAPKVNTWAGIYNDTVIGPFFIEGNITGDKYLEMMINEVGPALLEAAGDDEVYFQQDGAPAHFKRNVREMLDEMFPRKWIGRKGPYIWPARSPDMTPLDFFLWGHVTHRIFLTRPVDCDDLKLRIVAACREISPEVLQRVRNAFYNRLHYCLTAEGHQFEHLIK